ncbi:protein translocase subunit SecD [Patescibacteria group bacterium]|nr:protein translocase subunit SecD [Patescibacteria group bacterium]
MSNKKLNRLFLFILGLFFVCLFLSLPREINIFGRQLPALNINLGPVKIYRDLNVKQGLDLQGGTRVVLKADMENISPEDRSTAHESVRSVISKRVDLYGVSEANIKTSKVGEEYRLVVELPGIDQPQEALDLIGQTARLVFASPKFEVPPASPSAEPVLTGFEPTDLTGADLKRAQVTFETDNRQPGVSIEFKDSGKEKFSQLTKEYLNQPLAIILDDSILTAPTIQSVITSGQAVITGQFTTEEAKNLSIQLNAGALPVPVSVLSQKNIPATLGSQAVSQSAIAGGIGLSLVVLFMTAYYGWLGLIASFGLVLYGLITLSIYKLIPVTLTLPGIAGFLLSVGMAVDSNILIFERYKEEIRAGRSPKVALELGFGRAWDSIKDANTATIITALILFNPLNWSFLNTSGAVRGFALTLMIGIFISLFTGIVVTRTLLRLFYKKAR